MNSKTQKLRSADARFMTHNIHPNLILYVSPDYYKARSMEFSAHLNILRGRLKYQISMITLSFPSPMIGSWNGSVRLAYDKGGYFRSFRCREDISFNLFGRGHHQRIKHFVLSNFCNASTFSFDASHPRTELRFVV